MEPIFKRQPRHPGVAHYLIHLYDSPALAERGIDAALRYSSAAAERKFFMSRASTGAWYASPVGSFKIECARVARSGLGGARRRWRPGLPSGGFRLLEAGMEATMTGQEQRAVRALFAELKRSRPQAFPKPRQRIPASDEQGVYVIYSPRANKVVHVGRTYKGTKGLRQRLKNHLQGASSFTQKHLKGHGHKLRNGYTFRCLLVASPRRRALLENYATGFLCPAHLGTGE